MTRPKDEANKHLSSFGMGGEGALAVTGFAAMTKAGGAA